jgi:hypothetical protein
LHKHHRPLGLATSPTGTRRAADIANTRPVQPVTLLRPHAARRAARFFIEKFPGRSLYAVKANPSPDLLKVLWDAGITHYDVASMGEVRLVHETLPEAVLCFMHPVKAEEAIAEAYFEHGVKTFSLDTVEELEKIVRATKGASDLNLLVRLRVSSEHAKYSLAAKFGAEPHELKALLMAARQASDALGICFHVGSQAMSPAAYAEAMERVRDAIVEAAVTVDIVDVGGGFPSTYPGMEPPALETYFQVIHSAFEALPISYSAELWCEPSSTSTTARTAPCSMRRMSAGVSRSRSFAAGRRGRSPSDSAFTGRRATISTIWPARSISRPTSRPAIMSRSECSAPMAARCGPASTASESTASKLSTTSRWRRSMERDAGLAVRRS